MERNINEEINTSIPIDKRISLEIDDLEEDIIFMHNLFGVRKFGVINKKEKKKPLTILSRNIFAENTIIDSNEIEIIKTDQYLNILNPKIIKYLTYKDVDFNCTFMKNLYSYSEEIGFENTIGCLFPLVKELTFRKNIKPKIILSFFEGYEKFQNFLLKNNEIEGYKIIIDNIVPLIKDIILYKKDENLLKAASKALILIIKNSKEEENCSILLPILISLSHDDLNIKGQLLSIEIFNSIAYDLGEIITESYIVPHIQSFCEDSRDEIKICTIKNFINICNVISYDCFIQKIFPYYVILCKNNFYLIKKYSYEILPEICKRCKSDFISEKLINLFIEGSKDQQVKFTILSIFAEFINFLQKSDLENNKYLLEFYIMSTLELFKNKKSEYLDILYKIAFTLPGVILVYCQKLSIDNWNEIKKVYLSFFNEKDYKIKNTICSSFAQISKIIGSENSEIDIAPHILKLYDNNNIQIKNTILNVLPDYLNTIKDEKIKINFLKCFTLNNEKKWREKIKFLKVLGKLKDIYNIEIILNDIFPIILKMNFETVNKVRIRAAKELSKYLFKFTKTNDEYKIKALILLETFATCIHYHYRQLFVYISIDFMVDESIFIEVIFPLFYDLSFDKIESVRMTLSKILNKIIKKNKEEHNWILNNKDMKEIIFRLKNDKCKEVRDFIKDVEMNEDYSNVDINHERLDKINEKFDNKMNVLYDLYKINPVSLGSDAWLHK